MSKKTKEIKNTVPQDDSALTNELIEETDGLEEPADSIELTDIPIDQFLKDPKMAEISEESDVEEFTAWCPVCNDHTIFVDKTCTVCGFVKGAKKFADKDETEESTESTFELMPSDEVIDEMNGYVGFDDEEGEKTEY